MSPKDVFQEHLCKLKHPINIYTPAINDEGSEIFIDLEKKIRDFFNRNIENLNIDNLHFYLLDSAAINACAWKYDNLNLNFVGLTKGLVQYSFLIISNLFKENNFLPDVLGIGIEEAARYPYPNFESIHTFTDLNRTSWISAKMNPDNIPRSLIADSVFDFFIYFVIMHEVAHINQKNKGSFLEFSSNDKLTPEENLILQVKEWDADLYAIEQVITRLMNVYNDENIIGKSLIYREKETVCYFSILIPLLLFYLFAHRGEFKTYTKNFCHPHPNVRINYTINYLVFIYEQSSFLDRSVIDSIGKRVIKEFKEVLEKVFTEPDVIKYFELSINQKLTKHLHEIEELGKQMHPMRSYNLND